MIFQETNHRFSEWHFDTDRCTILSKHTAKSIELDWIQLDLQHPPAHCHSVIKVVSSRTHTLSLSLSLSFSISFTHTHTQSHTGTSGESNNDSYSYSRPIGRRRRISSSSRRCRSTKSTKRRRKRGRRRGDADDAGRTGVYVPTAERSTPE